MKCYVGCGREHKDIAKVTTEGPAPGLEDVLYIPLCEDHMGTVGEAVAKLDRADEVQIEWVSKIARGKAGVRW